MQLVPLPSAPAVDPEIRPELILTATDLWKPKALDAIVADKIRSVESVDHVSSSERQSMV
jgi:hypothetical protein